MRKTHALMRVAQAMLDEPTERQWGYDLSKRAGVRSGVLYPILTRMFEAGWLDDGWESPEEITGKRPARRYYVLTAEGQNALRTLLHEAR